MAPLHSCSNVSCRWLLSAATNRTNKSLWHHRGWARKWAVNGHCFVCLPYYLDYLFEVCIKKLAWLLLPHGNLLNKPNLYFVFMDPLYTSENTTHNPYKCERTCDTACSTASCQTLLSFKLNKEDKRERKKIQGSSRFLQHFRRHHTPWHNCKILHIYLASSFLSVLVYEGGKNVISTLSNKFSVLNWHTQGPSKNGHQTACASALKLDTH